MGLLDKIFGNKEEYQPLPQDHAAMGRLQKDMKGLETFVGEVADRLEVVPAEKASYIFIGKPPKMFGLAWIEGDAIRDFKSLGKEKGMTSLDLKPVMDKVKAAYEKNPPSERYTQKIGAREVIVAPMGALASEVEQAIQAASA